MNNILPEQIQEKILLMPEYSYGVNRVTLIMEDKTKVFNVFVAWGKEIIRIDSNDSSNIDTSRVVDVESQ